jgi:hypothetical protein
MPGKKLKPTKAGFLKKLKSHFLLWEDSGFFVVD